MAFIYGIENKINGKWYIGLTTRDDVTIRWKEHIKALNANRHVNVHLNNAWNKYGHLNFNFVIISEFPSNFSRKELANIEKRTIALYDSFKNGYNQTIGGDGVITRLYFEYTVSKMGFGYNGKQQYVICDRNACPLIRSIDKVYLESFLPLLNSDEEAGLKAIEEADRFKYTVAKGGFNSNGKQKYVIYDRNACPLIWSIDKSYLESFIPLLNSDEEAGLKQIEEADRFKYTVSKKGFNSTGKQKYVISNRNASPLIISIDKVYLDFVVNLLNSNESEWVIKENDKFKLKNKKLLKELFKNKRLENDRG